MYDLGQRVRCVDSRWGCTITGGSFQRAACPNLPQVGQVYTIRWCARGDEHYVRVVEVVNPVNPNTGFEPIFRAKQFVPLGDKETDIGFAYDILHYPGSLAKPTIEEREYFKKRKKEGA